jgi:hypothetical protein
MSSSPASDPIRGADGYPQEIELDRIRTWPMEAGWDALMEYVMERWDGGRVGIRSRRRLPNHKGGPLKRRYIFVTGGWSGNEDLIAALKQNRLFMMVCAERWERGGLYEYRVPV